LLEKYAEAKARLLAELSQEDIALIMYCWTSLTNSSYMTKKPLFFKFEALIKVTQTAAKDVPSG
jgi:hypothetical protein